MNKQRGRRLNFSQVKCCSQDPEYPGLELLEQDPQGKGWQSKRFCTYPQWVMIELGQKSEVRSISVLCHQNKIPTRILIHSKEMINQPWNRVGYISLQSNVSTNYHARELKTVKIQPIVVKYLKLILETNYLNDHNLFNQVAIICCSVYGQPIEEEQLLKPPTSNSDKYMLGKIRELERDKKLALDQEDYQQAERCKQEILKIKDINQAIQILEEKKKKAVNKENYHEAKNLQDKIRRLRGEQTTPPPPPYFSPSNPKPKPKRLEQKIQIPQKQDHFPQQESVNNSMIGKKQEIVNYDDRPINVKNPNPYENFTGEEAQSGTKSEVLDLQALSPELLAQCSPHFPVVDEQIFMYLFSEHHQQRQKGMQLAEKQVLSTKSSRDRTIDAFFFVIRKMIADKNAAVLHQVILLLGIGLKKLKPEPTPQRNKATEYILEKLNDYLGHNQQRVKSITQDLYSVLPNHAITSKEVCDRILTIEDKRQKMFKVIFGRLKMLMYLTLTYGLGKKYGEIISFAVKYLEDKNQQVRNMAINLLSCIGSITGISALEAFLDDVKPKIVEVIRKKVQNKDYRSLPMQEQSPRAKPSNKETNSPLVVNKKVPSQRSPSPIKRNRSIETQSPKRAQSPSRSPKVEPVKSPKKAATNPEYLCQYCGRFDKKLENDDYRDMHLYRSCPMLKICEDCKQVVQISNLTAHMLSECKNSKYFKRCPRCKESVHQRDYRKHTESKQCNPAKPPAVANRCPLCHEDIGPGQEGWRVHLAEEGCRYNPRK